MEVRNGDIVGAFTGTGDYLVIFLIYENLNDDDTVWDGYVSRSITGEITTIPFSEFVAIPSNRALSRSDNLTDDAVSEIIQRLKELNE